MKQVLVLLFMCLVMVLITAACGGVGAKTIKISESIPNRAHFLMDIRLSEFLDVENPLVGLLSAGMQPPTLAEQIFGPIESESPVDLRKIERVTVFGDIDLFGDGDSFLDAAPDEYIGTIITGTINQDDLRSSIESEEGPLDKATYKDREILEDEDGQIALVFLDGENTLVGSRRAVRDTIDVIDGEKERLSGPVFNAFQALGDDVLVRFSASIPPGAIEEQDMLEGIELLGFSAEAFSALQAVSLAFDTTADTIEVQSSFIYPDEDIALKAYNLFDGLKSLILGFTADEQVAELLDQLQIEASGSQVDISLSITIEQLGDAIDEMESLVPDLTGSEPGFFGEESMPAVPLPVS